MVRRGTPGGKETRPSCFAFRSLPPLLFRTLTGYRLPISSGAVRIQCSPKKKTMTRKQRHTLIFLGLMVTSIITAVVAFANAPILKAFIIWFSSSLIFLLLYTLICWFDVPNHLRRRPARPADFEAARVGANTAEAINFLERSELIKSKVFGGILHKLYRAEQVYREGTWACEVEIASDRILAWEITYESVASPVLDLQERVGDGRFLVYLGE